jgi:hypothetical protein
MDTLPETAAKVNIEKLYINIFDSIVCSQYNRLQNISKYKTIVCLIHQI